MTRTPLADWDEAGGPVFSPRGTPFDPSTLTGTDLTCMDSMYAAEGDVDPVTGRWSPDALIAFDAAHEAASPTARRAFQLGWRNPRTSPKGWTR